MKTILAGFLILGIGLFACGAPNSDKSIEAEKAEYAKEVRARQQPMIDELEGMLGADTKMTLFAINPTETGPKAVDEKWLGKKLFRGHIVRSSAPIEDGQEQAALIHALTDGMRETDGSVAECFEPYFGLTIERGDRKIDIVVCFSCLQAEVFGAYSDTGFILARTHADVFIASAKRHDLGLPFRDPNPIQPRQ